MTVSTSVIPKDNNFHSLQRSNPGERMTTPTTSLSMTSLTTHNLSQTLHANLPRGHSGVASLPSHQAVVPRLTRASSEAELLAQHHIGKPEETGSTTADKISYMENILLDGRNALTNVPRSPPHRTTVEPKKSSKLAEPRLLLMDVTNRSPATMPIEISASSVGNSPPPEPQNRPHGNITSIDNRSAKAQKGNDSTVPEINTASMPAQSGRKMLAWKHSSEADKHTMARPITSPTDNEVRYITDDQNRTTLLPEKLAAFELIRLHEYQQSMKLSRQTHTTMCTALDDIHFICNPIAPTPKTAAQRAMRLGDNGKSPNHHI